MADEKLKVVQAAFDAYFRGDEPALLEVADPDIAVTQLPDQPDIQTYQGHDGLLRAMREWTGTWDDYSIEVLGMREVGDSVLVSLRQRGRGKGSGIAMDAEVHFVFTVRGDKLTRWRMFPSEREALDAV
jgi:ketosteroid isomerase-like protein